ncbi:MAG: tetratricopeptide repeat protein [Fibrobacterota bacterium]
MSRGLTTGVVIMCIFFGCGFVETHSEEDYYWIKAEAAYDAGEYTAAISLYRHILTIEWSQRHDRAWYGLGQSYRRLAENEQGLEAAEYIFEAYSFFDRVSVISERGMHALVKQAVCSYELFRAYLYSGMRDSAFFYWERGCAEAENILKKWPQSHHAGDAAYVRGNLCRVHPVDSIRDSSVIWFEKVIYEYELAGYWGNALFRAGEYYQNYRNCWDRAEEYFLRYISHEQNHGDTLDWKFERARERLADMGVLE